LLDQKLFYNNDDQAKLELILIIKTIKLKFCEMLKFKQIVNPNKKNMYVNTKLLYNSLKVKHSIVVLTMTENNDAMAN